MDEFNREVRSRKSLVPSSRRRKCGVRSLRCTLPSDRLTNKEWIERNGPVMTYNLNKPMTWEQFTSSDLSNQAKEEYLNHLIERFSLNQRIFAEMFGVSVATLARTIKRLELNVNFVNLAFPSALFHLSSVFQREDRQMKHIWSVHFVPVTAREAVCGWFGDIHKQGCRFIFYPSETV